jgi:hypothetical protein
LIELKKFSNIGYIFILWDGSDIKTLKSVANDGFTEIISLVKDKGCKEVKRYAGL